MPDDRFLDGDPNEPVPYYQTDLVPFVQAVQRDLRQIESLLASGRTEDAAALACESRIKAELLLRTLEAPTLPDSDTRA